MASANFCAGIYQKENAVAALNALKVLDGLGFPTTAEQKKEGLEKVSWNGRFTVLDTEPLFVVDGAHNPAAADMLVQSIEHFFKGKRLIYIMRVYLLYGLCQFLRRKSPHIIRCLYGKYLIRLIWRLSGSLRKE